MAGASEGYTCTITAKNCQLADSSPAALQRVLHLISACCGLPLIKFGTTRGTALIQHLYVSLDGADLTMNYFTAKRMAVLTMVSDRPIKERTFRSAIRDQLQTKRLE